MKYKGQFWVPLLLQKGKTASRTWPILNRLWKQIAVAFCLGLEVCLFPGLMWEFSLPLFGNQTDKVIKSPRITILTVIILNKPAAESLPLWNDRLIDSYSPLTKAPVLPFVVCGPPLLSAFFDHHDVIFSDSLLFSSPCPSTPPSTNPSLPPETSSESALPQLLSNTPRRSNSWLVL